MVHESIKRSKKCARRAQISNFVRDRCGVKQKVIVQHYRMQQSTVSSTIRRRSEKGNYTRTEKRGRKPKLTSRGIRSLLKCTRENIFKLIRVITARFNEFRAVPIYTRIVWRFLENNGIKNYAAACKPYLTCDYQKRQMYWAVHHHNWSSEIWDAVSLSDETSVTLRPKMQRKRVWWQPWQSCNASNLSPSFKSGYIGFSVWAAFFTPGRTSLVLNDDDAIKFSWENWNTCRESMWLNFHIRFLHPDPLIYFGLSLYPDQ